MPRIHEGFRTEAERDDHRNGWSSGLAKLIAIVETDGDTQKAVG